jgi:hypothetical protein
MSSWKQSNADGTGLLINGEPIAVAEAAGFHARSNQRDRRRFAAVDLPHCRRTIKPPLTEATAAFTLKAYGSSFHPGAGSAAFANRQP